MQEASSWEWEAEGKGENAEEPSSGLDPATPRPELKSNGVGPTLRRLCFKEGWRTLRALEGRTLEMVKILLADGPFLPLLLGSKFHQQGAGRGP